MKRNLRHILRSVVFSSFVPGRSKHRDKLANQTSGKIYSYRTRNALLDIIDAFCGWLIIKGYQLDTPEQIQPEHVYQFLSERAEYCTQATIDSYRSLLASLGRCISCRCNIPEFDLHVPRVWAKRKGSGKRGAAASMPRAEYEQILEYCREHPSGSSFAVLLQNHLGGRATDVCYRMRVTSTSVCMTCKAGKVLFRTITPALKELLDDPRFAAYRAPDNSFFLPKPRSVNQYLRKLEQRMGLDLHSWHDIRRLLAQEEYDRLRRIGYSRNDALCTVGLWLNHGPQRQKLVLKSYVKNPW